MAAPIFVGRDEVHAYAQRINSSIRSLERDMYARTVYAHPENLRSVADALPDTAFNETLKKTFYDEAKRLESRAKTKSKEQIDKETSFGSRYIEFLSEWEPFFKREEAYTPDGIPGSMNRDYWDAIEHYETLFRKFHKEFQEVLGLKPSADAPPTVEDINKEHPGGGVKSLFDFKIPWTAIFLIGGGYLIWTQRDSIKSALSSKKELPEKTSEPA